MLSEWRDGYLAYENLQSRWPNEGLLLLRDLIYYSESSDYWLQRYIYEPPSASLLSEVERLRPTFRHVMNRALPRQEPFEDVYQAAIYMGSDPQYWNNPNYVYRGQRNRQWRIMPTLFRLPEGEKKLVQDEFNRSLNQLAAYSGALDARFPGKFNEYQRIAIAQHYGLKTWLLDITRDPLVALFFASVNGEENDVGAVTRFSEIEWERLSVDGTNRLGAITLIEVPDVPRIGVQKALFLNGSHPDLIIQYGAEQIEFFQKEGLVFENEYRGITKGKLFSDDDSFETFTTAWLSNEHPSLPQPLGVQPFPFERATHPLGSADYREMLQTFIDKSQQSHLITATIDKNLHLLCDFHTELQNYGAQYGSIHILIEAAERAMGIENFKTIIDIYRHHVEVEVFQMVLNKLRSTYDRSTFAE